MSFKFIIIRGFGFLTYIMLKFRTLTGFEWEGYLYRYICCYTGPQVWGVSSLGQPQFSYFLNLRHSRGTKNLFQPESPREHTPCTCNSLSIFLLYEEILVL